VPPAARTQTASVIYTEATSATFQGLCAQTNTVSFLEPEQQKIGREKANDIG